MTLAAVSEMIGLGLQCSPINIRVAFPRSLTTPVRELVSAENGSHPTKPPYNSGFEPEVTVTEIPTPVDMYIDPPWYAEAVNPVRSSELDLALSDLSTLLYLNFFSIDNAFWNYITL